jgi:hypothetical protein
MTADEVIALIRTMEPREIERLFVLITEYESEVRRRQASVRYVKPVDFEHAVGRAFADNRELFRKLAELEKTEREASTP